MFGSQFASGDYLLFLNNDVVFRNNAISIALNFMEKHPDVGICTVQNFDETKQLDTFF